MYREYGIQGRWPSPDPLGPGAFNLSDPQSLNLYAYVLNNPTGSVDPLGLVNIPGYRSLVEAYGALGGGVQFGATWNEFDLLQFALTPTGSYRSPNCADPTTQDCGWSTINIYGNAGIFDLFLSEGMLSNQMGGLPTEQFETRQQQCLHKVQAAVNNNLGTPSVYRGVPNGMDSNGMRGGAYNFNFFAPGVFFKMPAGPGSISDVNGKIINCGRFSNGLHIPVPGGFCNPSGDPTISNWGPGVYNGVGGLLLHCTCRHRGPFPRRLELFRSCGRQRDIAGEARVLAMKLRATSPGPTALIAVLLLAFSCAGRDATTTFHETGRVDESSLARVVASPRIYAFDLSPAGDRVALLVRSGDAEKNMPTWLVIADPKSPGALQKVQTGNLASYWKWAAYVPPQIFFTPDGKWLVVQEQQHVKIIDAATLRTVGTVEGTKGAVPVSICGASSSDWFAVSFARKWRRKSQLEKMPVHVAMIDVPDATPHGGWDADDVPQALSPDGKLAAVSDWSARGPLVKLDIVDTGSGKKLAILDGGFKFKKPRGRQPTGRVVGRFLSSKQIVLSPDDSWDRSGHHSGDSLRIVDFRDGRNVQELKPRRYGPTGELGVADGGKEIVIGSWYVKPSFYTHPHEVVPSGSAPELFVFSYNGRFYLDSTIGSLLGQGLRFRVSSDGSVIAVPQELGITVFRRTDH